MISIVFATETGTAESLCEETAEKFTENGLENRMLDLSEMSVSDLEEIDTLVAIVSTWGDGEPPSDSEDIFGEIKESSIDLSKMSVAVLSLGDTSYDLFCQFGKDLEAELTKRGATALVPRVDCDIDYEEPFDEWLGNLVDVLKNRSIAAGV